MPKHPTLGSFWRASTLSLGSIAFGSLIVTVLEIIRLLLNIARNNANAEGHRESKAHWAMTRTMTFVYDCSRRSLSRLLCRVLYRVY
jgi:Plasma-membrane choline transporter